MQFLRQQVASTHTVAEGSNAHRRHLFANVAGHMQQEPNDVLGIPSKCADQHRVRPVGIGEHLLERLDHLVFEHVITDRPVRVIA